MSRLGDTHLYSSWPPFWYLAGRLRAWFTGWILVLLVPSLLLLHTKVRALARNAWQARAKLQRGVLCAGGRGQARGQCIVLGDQQGGLGALAQGEVVLGGQLLVAALFVSGHLPRELHGSRLGRSLDGRGRGVGGSGQALGGVGCLSPGGRWGGLLGQGMWD